MSQKQQHDPNQINGWKHVRGEHWHTKENCASHFYYQREQVTLADAANNDLNLCSTCTRDHHRQLYEEAQS